LVEGKICVAQRFDDSDLSVVPGTQAVVIDNPAEYPGLTAAMCRTSCCTGRLSAWMNLNAAPLLVSATLQYSGTATDESNEVFGGTNDARGLYARDGDECGDADVRAADFGDEAEPVRRGWRRRFLRRRRAAIRRRDRADGAGVLGTGAPGLLLNLTGGRADWATMAAQIQRVEENIDLGQTRIVVGRRSISGRRTSWRGLRANRERRLFVPGGRADERSGSGNAARFWAVSNAAELIRFSGRRRARRSQTSRSRFWMRRTRRACRCR